MATITTTTVTNPLIWPATTLIDYAAHPGATSGYFALVRATAANTYQIWYSSNTTSWALYSSVVRANIAEVGSIFGSNDGWIWWCYRTNESNQDRIYVRRLNLHDATWSPEVLLSANVNGGVAGSFWGGLDIASVDYGPGNSYQAGMVIAAQTNNGGAWLLGFNALPGQNPQLNHDVMAGNRQLFCHTPVSGHHTPSIDVEHAGNGKSSGTPNFWITWGRNQVLINKLAWNGHGWILPSGKVSITSPLGTNRDYLPGRWDGNRFLIARHNGGSIVDLYERNKANTSTTTRSTPTHPQGTVRSFGLGYNTQNGNARVFAVGTSNNDLYYVDYQRALGSWGAWTLVTATDITGANVDNYSIRRTTYPNAKYDVLTAHAGVDIVHTALGVTHVPQVPTWEFANVPYVDGSAADAHTDLLLDWKFNDPDPGDTQSAYALSRQIGTDPLAYYRASDGLWVETEQKNTSTTEQLTLPAGYYVNRFDLGVGGFNAFDCTILASTAQSHSGGTSALLTTVGTPVQATGRTGDIPVSPSTSYSVEVWGYSAAGYGSFFAAIDWYTAGNVYISTSGSAPSALAAGTWGRRNHTATSPVNAAFAQIGPTIGGNPPNGTQIYVDDMHFGPTMTPWAAASDSNHTYRVKVWDATDVASNYSAGLTLVPSGKVNPTIVTPVNFGTWVIDEFTVTWSVAEQSAYQADVCFFGIPIESSGKVVSSETSHTFQRTMENNFNFSVRVWTWNADGLKSDMAEHSFGVKFVAPRVPTVVVEPQGDRGRIQVTVTNPGASTYVGAGAGAQGNNTSLNPAIPAGLTGDLLVVASAIENSGTGTPNTPATYTSLATFGNIGLFGKIRQNGEGAPTVTFAGGVAGAATSAQVASFREAELAVIGAPVTQLNASAQNIAYAGGTPASANCIVILFVWKQDGAATVFSTPAGFTKIGDIFNANGQSLSWYYQIQTAAAAVAGGTVTVTSGASAISRSLLVPISGVPNVLHNDIWRLRNGSFGDQIRVVKEVPVNGVAHDWRAVSGQEYLYQAFAIGDNGSSTGGLFTL